MHLAAWEPVRNTVPVPNVPDGHMVIREDEDRPPCRPESVDTPVTVALCPLDELATT
jgi:hypothetical protein